MMKGGLVVAPSHLLRSTPSHPSLGAERVPDVSSARDVCVFKSCVQGSGFRVENSGLRAVCLDGGGT